MAAVQEQESFIKKYGLLFAILVMACVWALPTPADLPTAGHRMIGILLFAVIIWMTECVSYPVSAVVIIVLMTFGLGTAPSVLKPDKILGSAGGLQMAISGFSNTSWALVAAALFLAAAMMITGLD